MRYYCSICKRRITKEEYIYSRKNFFKPLCRRHQPTKEAMKLGHLLKRMGWYVEFEKFDGYKHIDIAIVDAKVNIEVDGGHHNFSPEQALADLKRTYYSFKKGFLTLRIPNSLVRDERTLQKTAKFIHKFLNESIEQLEEDSVYYDDDFWF